MRIECLSFREKKTTYFQRIAKLSTCNTLKVLSIRPTVLAFDLEILCLIVKQIIGGILVGFQALGFTTVTDTGLISRFSNNTHSVGLGKKY